MAVRPKTKAPAPKRRLADPRNEALQRMTKAELVKTVKTLDKRVTKLLNEISTKDRLLNAKLPADAPHDNHLAVERAARFPWEQ